MKIKSKAFSLYLSLPEMEQIKKIAKELHLRTVGDFIRLCVFEYIKNYNNSKGTK